MTGSLILLRRHPLAATLTFTLGASLAANAADLGPGEFALVSLETLSRIGTWAAGRVLTCARAPRPDVSLDSTAVRSTSREPR